MRNSPQNLSDLPLFSRDCRAARSLRGWSQDDLAKRAGVGRATIMRFEAEASIPTERVLNDIRSAFEAAGIVFDSNGDGKRILIDNASWLILLGDTADQIQIGDVVSVMSGTDGQNVCANLTRGFVTIMAERPEHGQHAPSYARRGDGGIVFDVQSRKDSKYGYIAEVSYSPASK